MNRHCYLLVGGLVALVSLVAACAHQVEAQPGSSKVEIISKQQVGGDWGSRCERLGNITARVGPNPESKANLSAAEVAVRNKAHEKGATHVAVGQTSSYSCNITRSQCGTCSYTCEELPATAYNCESQHKAR